MFRPIKNFITYIQKNTGSGSIFGNASPNDNINISNSSDLLNEVKNNMDSESIVSRGVTSPFSDTDSNNSLIVVPTLVVEGEPKKFNKVEKCTNSSVLVGVEQKEHCNEPAAELILGLGDDEGDNIDPLSKSIDEANSSLTLVTSNSGLIDADPLQMGSIEELSSICSDDQIHRRNGDEFCSFESSRQATPSFDDDFQEFIAEPTQERLLPDDILSVGSTEIYTACDDTADEAIEDLVTEEEDEDATANENFIKIMNLAKPDVILVNDNDLNSSLASDALSEDPLATDNFPSGTVDLLETSSDSEDAEFLWQNASTGEQVIVGKISKPSDDECFIIDSIEGMPSAQILRQQDLVEQQTTPKSSSENQEELRCDNSDSGLGSETSTLLQTILTSPTDKVENSIQLDSLNAPNSSLIGHEKPISTCNLDLEEDFVLGAGALPQIDKTVAVPLKPLRSNLKRRLEMEDMSLDLTDGSSTSACSSSSIEGIHKKPKRSINFENVQVFYFPRQQGFGCVPSAGGCTLGMGNRHIAFKTLTLAEHAAELRRAHRLQLQDNPRGSSSEDSEESEEDYLSEGSGSDIDAETNGFLQPMSPKQRRALLKAAGVRKIDASEKAECRDIRNSREVCGCTCRDFCDPETCSCNQAGIKCQVDHVSFPCGCSRDACGNTMGRVEFNPARVRTHFIHTIMRLEMENRQQQNPATANLSVYGASHHSSASSNSVITAQNSNNQTANFYNSLQTQSNYSSGYASPAYLSEQNIGTNSVGPYYQQTGTTNAHYATNTQYHQIDSLDSSLFSANSNATPAYGEIMPNYSTNETPGFHHNMPYETITPVSLYSTYHQPQAPNSYSTNTSNYSSCAVPSIPPYGSATTTASSDDTHYQDVATTACLSLSSSVSLANTTITTDSRGSATNVEENCAGVVGGDSNFISLNTPIASSSRLSQINDLLQHNRNTTAALVAVTKSAISNNNDLQENHNGNLGSDSNCLAINDSIDTPPIIDTQSSSLSFDSLPPRCNPAPIVAVIENNFSGGSPSNPPQMEPPP